LSLISLDLTISTIGFANIIWKKKENIKTMKKNPVCDNPWKQVSINHNTCIIFKFTFNKKWKKEKRKAFHAPMQAKYSTKYGMFKILLHDFHNVKRAEKVMSYVRFYSNQNSKLHMKIYKQ
jgi:hypothetical protein